MRALHFGIILGLLTTWTATAFAGEMTDQVRLLKSKVPVIVCVHSTSKFEELTAQLNSRLADFSDALAIDRMNSKQLTVSAPSLSVISTEWAACVTVTLTPN